MIARTARHPRLRRDRGARRAGHARRATLLAAALALGAVVATGCDEVQVREGGGLTQPPVTQARAMRALVNPTGLEALIRQATPLGFELGHPPEHLVRERVEVGQLEPTTFEVRLGPIDQRFEFSRIDVSTGDGAMQIVTELIRPTVFVPVRVHDGVGAQICRYSVALDAVDMSATVGVVSGTDGPRLAPLSDPFVTLERPTVRAIGACPALERAGYDDLDELEAHFERYVRDAFEGSVSAAFRSSPLDTLGLIRRRIELSRLSAYESRRGHLVAIGRLSDAVAPVTLTPRGLHVELDVATSPRRAGCAPAMSAPSEEGPGEPTSGDATPGAPAPIPPESLAQFGADVGLSLSTTFLEQLARSMTSAGFACRGLDDPRPDDENREVVPSDELRLEDIGLDGVPIGPWTRLVLAPGSLPRITTHPERNDLELAWDELTVDLYGEVHGVLVRLLSVHASARLGLRPRNAGTGELAFDLDTIVVRDVSFDSIWHHGAPDPEALARWTRRLFFLTFDGKLSLPLPLDPGTPLTVVGSQIRDQDLVLLLRFVP